MGHHTRREARARRQSRVRQKISGTPSGAAERLPQPIADVRRSSTTAPGGRWSPRPWRPTSKGAEGLNKTEQAKLVGALIAERARAKGVQQVIFDRGGYRYHGRVRALAEAARQAGLEF
jgi:large subunit ribosomal protein L18